MTFASRSLTHLYRHLLPVVVLGVAGTLYAQVPDLAPANKTAPTTAPTTAPKPTPAKAPAATPPPATNTPASTAPAPAAPIPAASVPAPQTAAVPASTDAVGDGPFGFYAGETRVQILAAIGKAAIKTQKKDSLEVSTAPKPDAHFDTYTLIVSPKAGLLKVVATGKDLNDDPTGGKVRSEFDAVKADVTTAYGAPTEAFDFVKFSSKYKGPNQFILALASSDRALAAYWTKAAFPNSVNSISLDANALGSDTGYLSLEFEFNGYAAFITGK